MYFNVAPRITGLVMMGNPAFPYNSNDSEQKKSLSRLEILTSRDHHREFAKEIQANITIQGAVQEKVFIVLVCCTAITNRTRGIIPVPKPGLI